MIGATAALLLWALHAPAQDSTPSPDLLRGEIGCAPGVLPAPPVKAMRVLGGSTHGRLMFGPGEALIINAGSDEGVRPGQQYYVRREVHDHFSFTDAGFPLVSIHTAGWITVVEVREHMAVASVTHACDGVLEGDYLDPYTEPAPLPTSIGGAPDFDHPGRILMADEQRQTGFAGLLMLINRGSAQGVRAGQTVTIFRDTLEGVGPIVSVGQATVLQTSSSTALVRIDSSDGAVYVGDLAAIHRITQ